MRLPVVAELLAADAHLLAAASLLPSVAMETEQVCHNTGMLYIVKRGGMGGGWGWEGRREHMEGGGRREHMEGEGRREHMEGEGRRGHMGGGR